MTSPKRQSNRKPIFGATMRYRNSEMRIEELVSNFSAGKINLIPPFQRGRVWPLKLRQKLVENMVQGKPIPAIFLYKQEEGSRYSYNILDGKQRLESLLLFIANGRTDLFVPNWRDYFVQGHPDAQFSIKIADSPEEKAASKNFAQLAPEIIRDFREYAIPTIEIDVDTEDGSFDEIISLFIDVNIYGVRVNRFDIIRTMQNNNPFLARLCPIFDEKDMENFRAFLLAAFDFETSRVD